MEYFSTCNGIPVHLSDTKKGEKCILFLHGYLETLYIWDDFIKLFPPDYRVVCMDIPGHGLSGSAEINTMHFCADTAISLLKSLSIRSCSIVGHSMGGYVAIEAIKREPSLFNSLIMLHSTPFPDKEEKKIEREREISLIMQNKLQTILRLSIPKMFANENVSRFEEKIKEITEIAEVHDPEGITSCLRGMMSREDNLQAMTKITLPSLFIFGNEDNYIPIEVANIIEQQIEAATVKILDKSGHCGFIEQREKTFEIIINFLENLYK